MNFSTIVHQDYIESSESDKNAHHIAKRKILQVEKEMYTQEEERIPTQSSPVKIQTSHNIKIGESDTNTKPVCPDIVCECGYCHVIFTTNINICGLIFFLVILICEIAFSIVTSNKLMLIEGKNLAFDNIVVRKQLLFPNNNISAKNVHIINATIVDQSQIDIIQNFPSIAVKNLTAGQLQADNLSARNLTSPFMNSSTSFVRSATLRVLNATDITTENLTVQQISAQNFGTIQTANLSGGSIDAKELVAQRLNATNISTVNLSGESGTFANLTAQNGDFLQLQAEEVSAKKLHGNASSVTLNGTTISAKKLEFSGKVQAEQLTADNLQAQRVNAAEASVSQVKATNGTVKKVSSSQANAKKLTIGGKQQAQLELDYLTAEENLDVQGDVQANGGITN